MPLPLSSPPSRPAASAFRWFIVALLFLATTINYVDRQILALLKPILDRELGWHVPVADLTFWARASRAPTADATIDFRNDGLPATIRQDGWTIEYPDYDATHEPPLPRKIFASRGDSRVRLSISVWR